jgi:energy-coupling factor transport system ATP-binding protein
MVIEFKDVAHIYQPNSPFEFRALYNIDLLLKDASFTAIIGHTGSGKSTLAQHINALIKPTSGTVTVGDYVITNKKKTKNIKPLRKKAAMVFQYPEHQLFEETVEKDIMFGPLNFNVPLEQARRRAHRALELVGLTKDVLSTSPFDLSGGQMRRVAIAGVIAMEPEVLILDEPTAGLDPKGRKEIMDMFYNLHIEKRLTTILVTHHMTDAAHYADEIIVMNKGTVFMKGKPIDIFKQDKQLQEIGLDVPEHIHFANLLELKFKKSFELRENSIEHIGKKLEDYLKECDKL